MLFIVTYRGKSGSREKLEIEAENKTEVFAKLKDLGINAIYIQEGRAIKKTKGLNLISLRAKVISIFSIISIILIFVFFLNSNFAEIETSAEHARQISPIENVKPKKRTSFVARKTPDKTAKFEKPIITNPDVFFHSTFKGRLVKWKYRETPVFTNQFESFVGSVLTAIPGERFLEIDLEDEFDEAFKASLANKIEILADDFAEVAALKRAVIEAKEEIRRQLADGVRPRDIVTAARDELNKIADYRDNLQSEFDEYLTTETDPGEVLRFVKEANELLAEYGALPLEAPDDLKSAEEAMINAKENKISEIEAKLKIIDSEGELK